MQMPEQFFRHLYHKIKSEWKWAFLSAFLIGLVCHLYRFTNYLLTWDSLFNFYSDQNTIRLGRSFLTYTAGISSYYDLPLVNGLLSLCYISLSAALITELFSIKKKLTIILLSGILVTFPSVTSILAFNFTADGYFLGMLLAAAAVFFTCRLRLGFLPGAVCLCISYGSYQAFVTFAILLILLYVIQQILIVHHGASSDGSDLPALSYFLDLVKLLLRFLIMGMLGTLLYFLSLRLMLSVQGISLHTYQGISEMSVPSFSGLKEAAISCIRRFYQFFLGSMQPSLYTALNVITLMLLCIVSAVFYIRKRLWHNMLLSFLLAFCIVLIPFAASAIYFVSEGVWYHTLMCESFALILVLPLLFYDALRRDTVWGRIYSWALLLVLSLTIYNFILTANISYAYMSKSYETSYALVTRIADRIEQSTDDVSGLTQLGVIGYLNDYDVYTNGYPMFHNPIEMTGVPSSNVVGLPYDYTVMLNDYMGFSLTDAPDDVVIPFVHSEVYQKMPCWPAPGSIYVEGDTVYLKFSDVDW